MIRSQPCPVQHCVSNQPQPRITVAHRTTWHQKALPRLSEVPNILLHNKLIVGNADDMEDDSIFNSTQDANAPGLVQIGTKIQPGMSGAMSLLFAVREAMQFSHDKADPSFTILPIRDVNARPCPPIKSPKHEKGFPEYWAASL